MDNLPADFDAAIYLKLNADVAKASVDPINHYLNYGIKEGRRYKEPLPGVFEHDGLQSKHNHEFMQDPSFTKAYDRGCKAAGQDYKWYWRVHIGLWAASTAVKLGGDFVECGVNRGFLSSAIMELLDWDSLNHTFYLLDTFSGLDEKYVSKNEKDNGILERNKKSIDSGFYTTELNSVKHNFSQWKNINIVQGSIPETLKQIKSQSIAFLHIDLNCSMPEVEALNYLWPHLIIGGIVLLDDYAYFGYQSQKEAMDEWAKLNNVAIASLPSGQGLIIKT